MKHFSALLAVLLAAATQAQVTHELAVEDDEFNPSSLTINAGDHVHILWDNSVVNDHTFTQVAEATWNVNGDTPLPGGYHFGVGTPNPGTEFTITPTSSVWYVCEFHVSDMGMKGTITVLGGSGIEEATTQDGYTLAPNPAGSTVAVVAPNSDAVHARFIDASGRTCLTTVLNGDRTIDVSLLNEGLYAVELRDARGTLLSRQRSVIAR